MAEGFRIREAGLVKEGDERSGVIDLSKIDFKLLAKKFKESKKKNVELEALKAAIRAQLERMIRLNRYRTDYLTKFEELIDAYNAGSRNIDELFRELLELSRSLNEEDQRHVRENLNEEELVIFDILTRPDPKLSPDEREAIKKVTRDLLQRLKDLLVLDWRRNVQTRARVHEAIADVLDNSLPRVYTPEIYKRKCSAVFEHIYENYSDEGGSVYGPII